MSTVFLPVIIPFIIIGDGKYNVWVRGYLLILIFHVDSNISFITYLTLIDAMYCIKKGKNVYVVVA